MKTILATKSKLKNNLLVHQQLRRSRNGQHYQIAGNSRGNNYRPLLFVYLHNQVVTTALEPKGLSSGTKGKLVGKVRRLQNRDNPQPSSNLSQKDSRNAVQRLNGNGLPKRWLKIESVPTEMWLVRGILWVC